MAGARMAHLSLSGRHPEARGPERPGSAINPPGMMQERPSCGLPALPRRRSIAVQRPGAGHMATIKLLRLCWLLLLPLYCCSTGRRNVLLILADVCLPPPPSAVVASCCWQSSIITLWASPCAPPPRMRRTWDSQTSASTSRSSRLPTLTAWRARAYDWRPTTLILSALRRDPASVCMHILLSLRLLSSISQRLPSDDDRPPASCCMLLCPVRAGV
jgi:hypothetical protein